MVWEICEKDPHAPVKATGAHITRGATITMSKITNLVLLKSLMVGLLLSLAMPTSAVESKDPIKLTIHDWTGQYLTTHIMGEVLKQAGYNIEYVQADYIAQFAGLESGDLHVSSLRFDDQ